MARLMSGLILAAIFGLPALLVAAPVLLWPSAWLAASLIVAGPLLYSTAFVLVAGAISRPFQRAVVPGKFTRDLRDPAYAARRLYGLCWTSVYYFKPLYFLCLSIPALKRLTFRIFGYRGSMNFTVYPDTWIRDLPLLDFGEGAYLANRSTIGTNMALRDGTLLVNRVTVGAGSMVGHLTMLAPGVRIGRNVDIDVGCGIGLGVRIDDEAHVAGLASVHHFSHIGEGASIGVEAYVGLKARVAPGLKVPAGAIIPPGAHLESQDQVDCLISASNADVRLFARHGKASGTPTHHEQAGVAP